MTKKIKIGRKVLSQRRKKYVIDFIEKKGGANTVELAHEARVSVSTIRRDLNSLEEDGLILKTHGGAVPRSFSIAFDPPHGLRSRSQKLEKQLIGKLSSPLIKKGDTIIFDSGTTSLQAAHYAGKEKFTAICLDLPVAMKLANNPFVDVVILGGNVRQGIYSIFGIFAEEMLKKMHVDKFFMGADAIDLKEGITNASFHEFPLKQLAIRAAKEVILISDSTKFGKVLLVKVCVLQEVDKIITDEGVPPDIHKQLEEMDIEVIIAKRGGGS